MTIAPRVKIRQYEEGDENRIIDLLRPQWTHLSDTNALRNWRWEYRSGPRPAIVTVAECNQEIVGHYAVLPMRMKYGPTTVWGAKAEGGIVHPDFRGPKGLKYLPESETRTVYNLLITETLSRARAQGIQLVWGFPNRIAVMGQVRAGYAAISVPISRFFVPFNLRHSLRQVAAEMPADQHPLETYRPLAKQWFRFLLRTEPPVPHDDGLNVIDASGNASGIDALWERCNEEKNCITIVRGHEYLNWRMIGNPVLPHRVLVAKRGNDVTAYVSFAIIDRGSMAEGKVVDMMALENGASDLRAVLGRAVDAMLQKGVALITTWFARNGNSSLYRDTLREVNFLQSSARTMSLLVKTYNVPEDFAKHPDNWDLNMAFTEGVM